ncbi:MAG: DinB family protein [Microlunatus sp.]
MVVFSHTNELKEAQFTHVDLRGARFVETDLSGAVFRAVEVAGVEIDAPWLVHGRPLLVNGVDIVPFVEAELNRRFVGREDRRAETPDGLRTAWSAIERAWSAALERVADMPDGTVDVSVAGEWSFAQTLRHLILATDLWLGNAVLQLPQPFHPFGLPWEGAEDAEGWDMSVFTAAKPSYAEVLEARAGRVAMVREFLADVTPEQLAIPRQNPWSPTNPETTRSCLHVILEEEWEHLRFALRDLDVIESSAGES